MSLASANPSLQDIASKVYRFVMLWMTTPDVPMKLDFFIYYFFQFLKIYDGFQIWQNYTTTAVPHDDF
jgi:hypothetical protein